MKESKQEKERREELREKNFSHPDIDAAMHPAKQEEILPPEAGSEVNPSKIPIEPPTIDQKVDTVTNPDGSVDDLIKMTRKFPDGREEYYSRGWDRVVKAVMPNGDVAHFGTFGEHANRVVYPDGIERRFDPDTGKVLGEFDKDGKEIKENQPPAPTEAEKPVLEVEEKAEAKKREGVILKSKKSKKEEKRTPEEEVTDFISEYKLEELLPAKFSSLDRAQKLKVVRDLKQRIVDIVRTDAQTQYSQYLKDEMEKFVKPDSNILLRIGDTILEKTIKAAKKEVDLKKIEGKVFAEMRDSEKGKDTIAEDLKILTERVKNMDIGVSIKGNTFVEYIKREEAETDSEFNLYVNFNLRAFKFTKLPYEWGQETKGKHREEFEKAKIEYEQARSEVLKIKASREKPEDKGRAMLEMLQTDNSIQMEQLLSTHPEFEKALEDFEKGVGKEEILKTLGNFFHTFTGGKGKNVRTATNKLIFAGGYGAKMLATFIGGSAASTTALVAAPLVGATVGGLRANIRAKDELLERGKNARHGKEYKDSRLEPLEFELQKYAKEGNTEKQEELKEKIRTIKNESRDVVTSENLSERMTSMVQALEQASSVEERKKLLDQIKRRIQFTQQKIEGGLVNFGETNLALANQFNLVNTLNQALIVSASLEETTRKDIDTRVERFLSYRKGEVKKAQKEFIKKQTWKGIFIGTGAAFAGYGLRYFQEHLGSVAHSAPTRSAASSEGLIKRAEGWMHGAKNETENWVGKNNPWHQEKIDLEAQPHHTPGVPKDYDTNPANSANEILNQPDSALINNFPETHITIDHGHGLIWGIRHAQADYLKHLQENHIDPSKAPAWVHEDATKLAKEMGGYDPNAADGKDSLLVGKGSILSVDDHGQLSLHDSITGKDTTLIDGDTFKVDEIRGIMFHSGHNDVVTPTPETPAEKFDSSHPWGTAEKMKLSADGKMEEYYDKNGILLGEKPFVNPYEHIPGQSAENAHNAVAEATHKVRQAYHGEDHIKGQPHGELQYYKHAPLPPHDQPETIHDAIPGVPHVFSHDYFSIGEEGVKNTYNLMQGDLHTLIGDNYSISSLHGLSARGVLKAHSPLGDYYRLARKYSGLKLEGGIFGLGGKRADEALAPMLQKIASSGHLQVFKDKVQELEFKIKEQ